MEPVKLHPLLGAILEYEDYIIPQEVYDMFLLIDDKVHQISRTERLWIA